MKGLATTILVFVSLQGMAQDGRVLLEQIYHRYHGKWRKSLIFTQHTEKYRNDTLSATETWYETMVYPKKFPDRFRQTRLRELRDFSKRLSLHFQIAQTGKEQAG